MLLNKNKSALLIIDVQEKLSPLVLNSSSMILRCQWLEKLAIKMQVPILVSEQYPQGLGGTVESLRSMINTKDFISKVSFSCMQEAVYTERLNQLEKTQLILAGIEAHVCVLQTAMEMKEAGYEVFVVVDAVSSRHEVDLKYGLKRMKQAGIHLITTEMVFFEWVKKAGTPEFKSLSKEFLQ
ncbi:hydrolase [Legionella israelensis]|uniref:YcaC related amidohydrolase n=1 Tax=Legionella israelensis TaxID=454 RepID=A0A0W0VKB1_9GAMM|nr:hydrolase [Legionella israelensis]KTD20527.1 YcaC related amidohydrolase [Legionella israelensis]QBS10796.1 hydrolase [Legionella israelensis]SCY49991.1 Nicotinamidase-related amidase [Legionella israelensis DSM 19235]STX57772.1 YcaC like amidohydrolase [Legionella israelensis]